MAALDPQSVQLHRSGSGPPLVLLHCLGVDHRFWDFAVPLASDFTLLRYDLPGHGSTPVPAESYRIEDLSDQLAAVLAQHGISRPHVAGISLGGLIAQHFAANEVVDRLVLIDTTPRYTEEMRAMWVERAATARMRGVAALIEDLLGVWFPRISWRRIRRRCVTCARRWRARRARVTRSPAKRSRQRICATARPRSAPRRW